MSLFVSFSFRAFFKIPTHTCCSGISFLQFCPRGLLPVAPCCALSPFAAVTFFSLLSLFTCRARYALRWTIHVEEPPARVAPPPASSHHWGFGLGETIATYKGQLLDPTDRFGPKSFSFRSDPTGCRALTSELGRIDAVLGRRLSSTGRTDQDGLICHVVCEWQSLGRTLSHQRPCPPNKCCVSSPAGPRTVVHVAVADCDATIRPAMI